MWGTNEKFEADSFIEAYCCVKALRKRCPEFQFTVRSKDQHPSDIDDAEYA